MFFETDRRLTLIFEILFELCNTEFQHIDDAQTYKLKKDRYICNDTLNQFIALCLNFSDIYS